MSQVTKQISEKKKGVISLGGSISKHHAILAALLNGGLDYAVYMTTARSTSGSMSGATTNEAKSWGKVKDASDVATVIGDVTITFPLAMIGALEQLEEETETLLYSTTYGHRYEYEYLLLFGARACLLTYNYYKHYL